MVHVHQEALQEAEVISPTISREACQGSLSTNKSGLLDPVMTTPFNTGTKNCVIFAPPQCRPTRQPHWRRLSQQRQEDLPRLQEADWCQLEGLMSLPLLPVLPRVMSDGAHNAKKERAISLQPRLSRPSVAEKEGSPDFLDITCMEAF